MSVRYTNIAPCPIAGCCHIADLYGVIPEMLAVNGESYRRFPVTTKVAYFVIKRVNGFI